MSICLPFVQYGGLLGLEIWVFPVLIMCSYSKGHAMQYSVMEETLMIEFIAIHGTSGNGDFRIKELFGRFPCSLITD